MHYGKLNEIISYYKTDMFYRSEQITDNLHSIVNPTTALGENTTFCSDKLVLAGSGQVSI